LQISTDLIDINPGAAPVAPPADEEAGDRHEEATDMHDASTTIEAQGGAAAGLLLGLVGAPALAGLLLATGYGPIAACLGYSLGGATVLLTATLGRAMLLPPARPARVRPAPAASTFA
jgi:hypothetical protein